MGSRNARPTVAFLLPSLGGGGAERATLNLSHYTSLQSIVVVERPEGELLEDPLAADAVFVGLKRGASRSQRMLAIARTLRRLRPDVVVGSLSPLTAAIAGRAVGARIVYWLQNPPYFMPGIAAEGMAPHGRAGLRMMAALANLIAGATPGLCREWAYAGVRPAKLALLPNGLSVAPMSPPGKRQAATPLRLLTIGRLTDQKRHDVVLRALSGILESRPAELTVLGRGELDAALRSLTSDLGLERHVTFAGFASDAASYLRASDVFLLASDYEGFGNVIVEALAAGLPVVCTDAPHGPRFIRGDCRAVTLVPCDNPTALANAAIAAAQAAGPALAYEAHSRARAFSIERVSAHFERLVEGAINGVSAPSWSS